MRSDYVWVDGSIVPFADATVHILTPALHYGVAVFEGIRCYRTERGPAVFRLMDHLDRLRRSAAVVGFRDFAYTSADLADAVRETVRANDLEECYIRPVVYLAEGGWNLTVDAGVARCAIAVWKWNAYLGPEALDQGVRANVSSFTRLHPNIAMTKAKIAGNYVNSVLAKTESMRLGFDEAIMLDAQGWVAECTGENLFAVSGGRLSTPPTAAILDGITRDTVMTLAREAGIEVCERALSRDDLYTADELFVCGTAAEIVGLREVDFRPIGRGRTGPITRRLQQVFRAVVTGRHSRSAEWLDPIGDEPGPRGNLRPATAAGA